MGGKGLYASDSGGWVRFADHESALAALRAERDEARGILRECAAVMGLVPRDDWECVRRLDMPMRIAKLNGIIAAARTAAAGEGTR